MPEADLIVVNGRVFESGPPDTVDDPGMTSTAVAVRGDRIVEIGSDEAVLMHREAGTEVFDARGATVMPAFDDAHTHLRSGSIALDQLDLFGLASLDAIQAAIRRYADAHPDREWIVGRGWLYASVPGGAPTREQLDAVVPDRPAYFECFDGHTGWANSAALAAAGIDADTPDPRDGRIVRDDSGAAAGLLLESALDLVESILPKADDAEMLSLVRRGLLANAAAGIGSCQDAWARPEDLALFHRLADLDGGLPIRVRMAMELLPGLGMDGWTADLDRFEAAVREHAIDGWLRGGILKSFMDGVVETRTASMLAPYPGTETRGEPRWTDGDLRDAIALAHRRGWQVKLHAIGTAAVRQALDAYEALGEGEARRRRHRVEHIETLDPADLSRFAELGVVASFQPFHAVPDAGGVVIWSEQLGPELAGSGWRLRSLLESGAPVAFGSDWPVVPLDPFLEIHAAVNRRTTDVLPPEGFYPAEALTLPQALAAATWGSAFAEHAEMERGSLEVGKLADLIVLDRDLLADGPSAILGTKPALTVVGGKVVHRGGGI
jgi:predicted amidohydrolase YtcJ